MIRYEIISQDKNNNPAFVSTVLECLREELSRVISEGHTKIRIYKTRYILPGVVGNPVNIFLKRKKLGRLFMDERELY